MKPTLIPTVAELARNNGKADPNVVDGADFILGTSWRPVNLTDALNGVDIEPPTILARVDGPCLLYPGRVHWFQGESESLKTWAALTAIAEVIANGGTAGFIDFEDDERGFISRLRALGVNVDDAIKDERLVYIRPDEPLADRHGKPTTASIDFGDELAIPRTLWVIDGVTESMTTEGLELLDNADIARWMSRIPKKLADTGAAVVCIDHVTKSKEGRGRYAIGGQHKLAGISGASYTFTTTRPLARATGTEPITASITITVNKDRPGHIRAHAIGAGDERRIAIFEVTAWPDAGISTALLPPDQTPAPDLALCVRILEHLSIYEGASKKAIEDNVGGKAQAIRDALAWMAAPDRVWISVEKVGQTHQHTLTDAGREYIK